MSKFSQGLIMLPDSELTIMQLIWDMEKKNGGRYFEITASAMLERYPEQLGHIKLTTILTLITRLASKNCLRIERGGRANYYIPLVTEADYNRAALDDFLKRVYHGDPKALILAVADESGISREMLSETIEALNERIKE